MVISVYLLEKTREKSAIVDVDLCSYKCQGRCWKLRDGAGEKGRAGLGKPQRCSSPKPRQCPV